MSATSKRNRALRDGLEPVTGKDMMDQTTEAAPPPVEAPPPEPEPEEE